MSHSTVYMQAFSYVKIIWKKERKDGFIIRLLLFRCSQLQEWSGEFYQ